jgi:hypothetical protein
MAMAAGLATTSSIGAGEGFYHDAGKIHME